MGRQALGAAAKSETGSVRVTKTDSEYFKKTYGGLGKFLQRKVNEELSKVEAMREVMGDRE